MPKKILLVALAGLLAACPSAKSTPDGGSNPFDGGTGDGGGGGGDGGGGGGDGGDGGSVGKPVITFSATPGTIANGQSARLDWQVLSATDIQLSDGTGVIGTGLPATGSRDVSPTANTTYTLSATGPGGSASATAAVTVVIHGDPPSITSFTALKSDVGVGKDSAVSWKTQLASKIELRDDAGALLYTTSNGAEVTSGSHVLVAIQKTTTYGLTAIGPGGQVTASTTITVHPVPSILTFAAASPSVLQGNTDKLSWNVTGADSVALADQTGATYPIDPKGFVGNYDVSPSADTVYTLTAANVYGNATSTVTVKVLYRAVIGSFTATPSAVASAGKVTLAYATTNAVSIEIAGNGSNVGAPGTPTTGSFDVYPTANTTYVLTAHGTGADDTASVSVTIIPPPTTTVTVSPNPATAGQTVTLSWTTSGATGVTTDFPAATVNPAFQDISATGTLLAAATGDGGSGAITFPSGFTFPYFGANQTQAVASVNGWLGFNASYSSAYNYGSALPSSSGPANAIAAFWDDLDTKTTGKIYWQLAGTAPNRTLTIQWSHLQFYSTTANPSDLNFEVILNEGGAFDVVYGTMTSTGSRANGSSAVVGYQDSTAALGYTWSSFAALPPGGVRFFKVPPPLSGSVSFTAVQTTAYTVTATGAGGTTPGTATLTVYPTPVISTFAASPTQVGTGEPSVLSWVAQNTSSVVIKDGAGNTVTTSASASGNVTVNPTATTVYTLTATNAAGALASATATVTVAAPTISAFSPSRATVPTNTPVTLSWQSKGASTVTVSAGASVLYTAATQADRDAGSYLLTPAATTTYTLTAKNASGQVTQNTTVTVFTNLVINDFAATPAAISAGATSTLAWHVDNATSVSISAGAATIFTTTDPAKITAGSTTVTPGATTVYTLTAVGLTTGTATTTVSVYPMPAIASFTASAGTITWSTPVTLSWTTTDAATVKLTRGATDLGVAPSLLNGSFVDSSSLGGLYTLTATNAAGAAVTATVTVTLSPPGTPTLTATPAFIGQGGTATLTWTTSGAQSVTLDPGAVSNTSGTFEDISATGTAVTLSSFDEATAGITFPAGFTFPFYGAAYGAAVVSSNGWLGFNGSYSSAAYTNSAFPDPYATPLNAIAGFWDDLDGNAAATTKLVWQLLGTAPNRRLVVEWYQFDLYSKKGANLTFEVKLFENGDFDIAYGTLSGPAGVNFNGAGATVGYQDGAGARGQSIAYNQGILAGGAGYHYSGAVALNGSVAVSPAVNTTYTLTAVNPAGSASATATVAVAAPGQLAVSELLSASSAAAGQWIEIYNPGSTAMDLRGIVLTETTSAFTHTIAGASPVSVPAKGYLVLGQSTDTAQNGGVPVSYAWGGSALPSAGTLQLKLGTTIIDAFAYGGTGWPGATNKSVGLDPGALANAAANNDKLVFLCAARTVSGTVTATPGAANDTCYEWVPAAAGGFVDIAATGTATTLTSSVLYQNAITLPFAFPLFGTTTTACNVSRSGFLNLGNALTFSVQTNADMPDATEPNGVIAPFWDAITLGATSKVVYQVVGSAPTRRFVMEWVAMTDSATSTDSMTFEAILGEDGSLEYEWGAMGTSSAAFGSSATIGVESLDGLFAVKKSYNTAASVAPNTGVVLQKH